MAHVDGWADAQYCSAPVAEDYKLNTLYDCSSYYCSYSAYVEDHVDECSSAVNYCFTSETAPRKVPVFGKSGIIIMSMLILLIGFSAYRYRSSH